MVDANLLKGKIIEKGLSIEKIAAIMGINKSSLYRKIASPDCISIKDINILSDTLELNEKDIISIFFSVKNPKEVGRTECGSASGETSEINNHSRKEVV